MRIVKVELKNWASYKGMHEFDFSSKSNRNGYAIFGENSRGKTSFTDAIQWAMYGEAFTKGIMGSDGKEVRKRRPLVSARQEDNPLLNVDSFREGQFDLMVRIRFDHKGKSWTLARVVAPDSPLVVNSDKNMGSFLNLISHEDNLENKAAQEFIDNMLPKGINKFFFIDGESVNEYRALIANTEQNLEIRKNIEDILNFPILKRGIVDLKTVTARFVTQLNKLSKDTKRNRILKKKIDANTIEITKTKEYLVKDEIELESATKEFNEIETKLGMLKETETLIERQRGNRKLISSAQVNLANTYNYLKKENKNLWLYLLQPALQDKIKTLAPELEKLSDIRSKISTSQNRSVYLQETHRGDKTHCPTCRQMPEPRDAKQIKKEVKELEAIVRDIEHLNEELRGHENASKLYNSLQKFNTTSRLDIVEEYEGSIGTLQGEIDQLEEEQNELKSMLDGLDDEEIKQLKNKLNQLQDIKLKKAALVRHHENKIAGYMQENSLHSKELIGSDGSDESMILEKKIKALDCMLNLWSTVTNEYTQETRVVIEKRATETFRLLTNNPKGYNKLELNSGFGVKILDSDGYVVPAPSPGAQQVVAISLIDALRQTSDIEFPILFDTPGASIDKVHRDKIIKHFWSKRDEQLIILAHSGEFRPDEVEKENKELLARTWQLDFNSGINSTVVTPRLVR
jgi:DNA sulfur modification protein DndD